MFSQFQTWLNALNPFEDIQMRMKLNEISIKSNAIILDATQLIEDAESMIQELQLRINIDLITKNNMRVKEVLATLDNNQRWLDQSKDYIAEVRLNKDKYTADCNLAFGTITIAVNTLSKAKDSFTEVNNVMNNHIKEIQDIMDKHATQNTLSNIWDNSQQWNQTGGSKMASHFGFSYGPSVPTRDHSHTMQLRPRVPKSQKNDDESSEDYSSESEYSDSCDEYNYIGNPV